MNVIRHPRLFLSGYSLGKKKNKDPGALTNKQQRDLDRQAYDRQVLVLQQAIDSVNQLNRDIENDNLPWDSQITMAAITFDVSKGKLKQMKKLLDRALADLQNTRNVKREQALIRNINLPTNVTPGDYEDDDTGQDLPIVYDDTGDDVVVDDGSGDAGTEVPDTADPLNYAGIPSGFYGGLVVPPGFEWGAEQDPAAGVPAGDGVYANAPTNEYEPEATGPLSAGAKIVLVGGVGVLAWLFLKKRKRR